MKAHSLLALLTAASLILGSTGNRVAAGEPEVIAAVQKATADLTAADKAVVDARNALRGAQEALEKDRFSSAAYNARVTAEQVVAAKEKHEKADAAGKEEALEMYELAEELAAQSKTAHEAAEKLLPQREAEAKAAEEKYTAALAAAEAGASQIKTLVREAQSDAQVKLRDSKLAIEKAAFTKATAEQTAATGAAITKTMTELEAADTALQSAIAAVRSAPEAERARKLEEAVKGIKAGAVVLEAAVPHLPPFAKETTKAAGLVELCHSLTAADKAAQKANAELQAAKDDVQNKTQAVKQAEERVKAATDSVEKRIAKTRARKDLVREQEAVKRAVAAKEEAEKALPAKTAGADQAQKAAAAALDAVVKSLVQSPELDESHKAGRLEIAKATADKAAAMKTENEKLAAEAALAREGAEAAQTALAASEKLVSDRAGLREPLEKIIRQRFYRDASTAQNELRLQDEAIAQANRELEPLVAAFNKATTGLNQAKDAVAKAQANATAQTTAAAGTGKEKEAAEKSMQEKSAARDAAAQAAKESQAAVVAAQEALAKAPAEGKAAAEKTGQEKTAEAQASGQKLTASEEAVKAAQGTLEKTVASLGTANNKAAETTKAAKDAEQAVAPAQAAFEKAAADKNAGEQKVAQCRQASDTTRPRILVAKTAAYGGLKPLDAAAWDAAKARHLMVRAGFGGTPAEVAKLHAMGLHAAVRHFVNFTEQAPGAFAIDVRPKEQPENIEAALRGEDQQKLRERRAEKDRRQIREMRAWWLRRMIESPRPLEEKLTLFWHGQIPVQHSDVGDSYYMYLQNELYRSNAAGNFATLLHGVVHDAAMLKYLNNDTNVKGKANENLAREIMELFSMGRDQGYSEIDIRQGARALTGYTYDPGAGQFRFISDRHDTEPKTIFGKTGNWCGDDFVRIILETPAPAKFVARQMFSFFAHSEPSIDTVESLARVLQLNNYDLAPMLENLFLSEEFYSPRAVSTDVKSPVQLIAGLHRDLGLKNPDYEYLASAVREMGQDLFDPPSVFGWQTGRPWVTTSRILNRYNVLAEVLESRPRAGKTGVDVVGTLLAGTKFQNHAEVVDYLVKCSWLVPLPANKRQALIEFLKPLPEPSQWAANPDPVNARLTRLLVMLACSPEYQLG